MAQHDPSDLQGQLGSVCPALQHSLLSILSIWLWLRNAWSGKPLILLLVQVPYFQLWTNLLGCFLLTP